MKWLPTRQVPGHVTGTGTGGRLTSSIGGGSCLVVVVAEVDDMDPSDDDCRAIAKPRSLDAIPSVPR